MTPLANICDKAQISHMHNVFCSFFDSGYDIREKATPSDFWLIIFSSSHDGKKLFKKQNNTWFAFW